MSYIDISIKGPIGVFTKKIKPLGLSATALLKVPAHNMTAVRVTGAHNALTAFIHEHFSERAAAMHLLAIKNLENSNA